MGRIGAINVLVAATMLLSMTGCQQGNIPSGLEAKHMSNLLIKSELDYTVDTVKYEGFIEDVLYKVEFIHPEELGNAMEKYLDIVSDELTIELYSKAQVNKTVDDNDKGHEGDNSITSGYKSEIDMAMRDAGGKVLGIAKDFEELRIFLYTDKGALINPRDYGYDYDVDYGAGNGAKRHENGVVVGGDTSDEEPSIPVEPLEPLLVLSLASKSVYKDTIVLKYIDLGGALRIYSLHLNKDGGIVSYESF